MRIALAQLNIHTGNFKKNVSKIKAEILKAGKNGIDLIVFSELTVCGYPPYDLLERDEFIYKCLDAVKEISAICTNTAAIIGSPTFNSDKRGKRLKNSAFFLSEGKINKIIHKTLLPDYDVYDEYRYFEPNSEFDTIYYRGKRIAITICEDLWDDYNAGGSKSNKILYKIDPLEKLMKLDPDFVVNISASPFSCYRSIPRENIFGEKAARYNIPVIYVNQVGAQTEFIFDGASMILGPDGNKIKELASFREDYFEIDFETMTRQKAVEKKNIISEEGSATSFLYNNDMCKTVHNALVLGIRDYFQKSGLKFGTLGLSGGIDSALTLVLASEALGSKNMKVLLMPSRYSSDHSINDAIQLANNLNVEYSILYIEEIQNSYEGVLGTLFNDEPEDVTEENIQARIRANLLMALSNNTGHILLNTSNKSEAAVGYGTLYGDTCGALSVLGDVYKTNIYRLAGYINQKEELIPQNTINKPPSAELKPGQIDADFLPDYKVLDNLLFNYIELNKKPAEIIDSGFDKTLVKKLIKMVDFNEYKRHQFPPVLRISSKAFGYGRKMPLAAKF